LSRRGRAARLSEEDRVVKTLLTKLGDAFPRLLRHVSRSLRADQS